MPAPLNFLSSTRNFGKDVLTSPASSEAGAALMPTGGLICPIMSYLFDGSHSIESFYGFIRWGLTKEPFDGLFR